MWALALALLGSCSSNSGSNGFSDGGAGQDSGKTHDGSSNGDAPGDSSKLPDSGADSGKHDGGSTDSGMHSDGAVGFPFDGFGYPDGTKPEAAVCPDDDKDGFPACGPGCPAVCDCDDHNSLVNPCAFDTDAASGDPVGVDGIDNDCDGMIDNLRLCDSSLSAGHDTTASDYANASDICDNKQCTVIVSATFYGPNNSSAHRITSHMGSTFTPKLGSMMSFFSDGIADDDIDDPGPSPPLYRTGDGTDLGNTYTNPYPFSAAENTNPCGTGTAETASSPAVHDYTELRLKLKAPRNAAGFSFMFNFFSEEYPYYVCQGFNDHFLALLTSKKYPSTTQIAFDSSGHPIDVNNSFFTDCTSMTAALTAGFPGGSYTHTCTGALSLLNGTSYEIPYCCSGLTNGNANYGSGATDWLTTTAPISPGETFTLSFIIFDEKDGILDSAINIDSFRWTSNPISSPVTAR